VDSIFENPKLKIFKILAASWHAGTTKQQKKNAFVVEKYVGQLGEKSHRIIARIDGTVILGRECGRERVWGRCFSFFWNDRSRGRREMCMRRGKNNGHIF